MAAFGPFAPFGVLTFGAQISPAQVAYDGMVESLKGGYDMTEGTHKEASTYARALAIASDRAVVKHAKNQRRPKRVVEMLAAQERQYRLSPAAGDSEEDRRGVLAARKLISRGSKPEAINQALTSLLGDRFVTLRVFTNAEMSTFPASPGSVGAWDDPATLGKFFRLLTDVSFVGVPVTFSYEPLLADGSRMEVGDALAFEVENPSLAEAATITSVDHTVTPLRATATFVRAHGAQSCVRSHAPLWSSTKRSYLVVVSDTASIDDPTIRKINALMDRIVRATSTWSIIRASSGTTIGPFTVGVSPLGAVPLGTLSIP